MHSFCVKRLLLKVKFKLLLENNKQGESNTEAQIDKGNEVNIR